MSTEVRHKAAERCLKCPFEKTEAEIAMMEGP